jgi:hypothetical protein
MKCSVSFIWVIYSDIFFCFYHEHVMAHSSQSVACGNYAKYPCLRSYNSSLFVGPKMIGCTRESKLYAETYLFASDKIFYLHL